MKPISFPESNVTFAKNQPQYQPLPAYRRANDPHGIVVSCWGLSWRERIRVFLTGRIFVSNMTFNGALQPQLLGATFPDATKSRVTVVREAIAWWLVSAADWPQRLGMRYAIARRPLFFVSNLLDQLSLAIAPRGMQCNNNQEEQKQ